MPAWRSTVSAGSELVRARLPAPRLPLALALLVVLGPASAAWAQTRIAVVPIEGPTGDKVTQEARKAARRVGEVVAQSDWDASAAKLFATSRSASDLAAVATDLNVQIVVTGKVKQGDDGGAWELSMSVRQGKTGKSSAKLKYPLKAARVDAATLKHVAEELPPAIEAAAAAPEAAEAPEPAITAAPGGDDNENPIEATLRDKQGPQEEARPEWANWFEARLGARFGSRSFGFDDPGTPSFASAGTGGLDVDATILPLAFLAKRSPAAAGLGVGGSFGVTFWPDSHPCFPAAGGGCLPTADSYPTAEHRFEVGLRWRWNVQGKFGSPQLRLRAQYGEHAFSISKRSYLADGLRDIGPPDVRYTYLAAGLGGLFPVFTNPEGGLRRLALFLDVDALVPFGTGPVHTPEEWGPGRAIGFRLDAGIELRLRAGLFLVLGAQLEFLRLSFDQPPQAPMIMPPCPCGTTQGATDLYYSGLLAVGYAY